MKTIRLQLPQQILCFITILTLMMYCIGCLNVIDEILDNADEPPNGDGIDDSWIIAEMPVREIVVLIAESFPVQVSVEVIGYLSDGCTARHETHTSREGNTVTIKMTTKRSKDRICTKVVTDIRERISIGTFAPGNYLVIVNGVKKKFRVD
jgi:inhibitor of cysteine peptidase